jgi:hypothetical protein
MTTRFADTHAHEYTLHALELLTAANAMLSTAYKEPSLEPTPQELDLIRAAKAAHLELHKIIFAVARTMDRASMPEDLANRVFPKEAGVLLEELRQEPAVTAFERD